MNVLVVFTHPSDESFCHQIYAHTLGWFQARGHSVKSRHLYKLHFDPVLSQRDLESTARQVGPAADIAHEQAYVAWAELIVFIYPIWWWDRPAILKGWFDRVMTRGFAFEYTPDGIKGKLGNKRALVIQTVGMPGGYPQITEKGHLFKRSIADGALAFCAITDCEILTLCGLSGFKLTKFIDQVREVETFLESNVQIP